MSDFRDRQPLAECVSDDRMHEARAEVERRLASGAVHEMNNALNAIMAFADLALQGAGDDADLRADIGEIRHAADRAAEIARRLLSFSRRQSTGPERIPLNRIVGRAEVMLRRLVGPTAALEIELAADAGSIRATPWLIEQIIVNLALNARDAMLVGCKLFVETAKVRLEVGEPAVFGVIPPGDYAVVRIGESGRDAFPDLVAPTFEPFFALARGRGVALPEVHGVVRQSRGFVRVKNRDGGGSCVEIYLARLPDDETSDVGRIETEQRSVLLVDDEEIARRGMARILGRAGYRVFLASSGVSALDLCDHLDVPLDLLVSDIVMPGMDGQELASLVVERFPGVKILLITGYADEAISGKKGSDSGREIIQKPFSAEELLAKTREVLEN